MRRIVLTALLLLFAKLTFSQINAVTESGDEVVLYQDGTWKYANDSTSKVSEEIPVNDGVFTKDKKSTFLVKSKTLNIGIWINPKEWNFTKGKEDDVAEYKFDKKGEDLFAMLISEKTPIPLETLKDIALQNARNAAPDVKIVRQEFRNVNGIKVLMLEMAGTIKGIKFTYYGYYYSNDNGTIQLLTYTGSNLFDDYFKDIELFLNGLVEL